jgi:NodT family efflux transporter outer membrane factor (OMF) lipoprotein
VTHGGRFGYLGLAVALLAACAVGPNFKPPHEPVPAQYTGVPAADATPGGVAPGGAASSAAAAGGAASASANRPSATVPPTVPPLSAVPPPPAAPPKPAPPPPVVAPHATSDAEPDAFWWQQFHDTNLDDLEKRAAGGNLDLKAAYLRIVESRIQVMSARAQGLPQLNASASYMREQLGLAGLLKTQGIGTSGTTSASTQQLLNGLEKPVNIYQLGFDASWELDLFGKVRRNVEAAKAAAAGSVESRNDLLVTLEADVAQNYLQMRAAQALRQVTLDLIASQRDVVELTTSRHEHGLAGEADVASAQGQLANLESQLPPYEQTIATARHALAVLIGQPPEALDTEFDLSGSMPSLPAVVPVGLPSTLARRRPDIRSAEDSLHQATAQIGVAVAAFFPDITLSGTYGLRNTGTRYLFDSASNFYTFGPKISLPIFDGGSVVANVRLTRAEAEAAALNYRKTVLSALQDIEDDLTALTTDAARSASLRDAVLADQRALDVDLDAYRHGILSYINVLSVQIQVVQARQQLAESLLTQSTDLVKLYKALGGGWENAPRLDDEKAPPVAAAQP